jgi:phosphonate transport system substrate-binding protein
MFKMTVVFLVMLMSFSLLASDKRVLFFSPLPMKKTKKNIEEFIPLINYMQDKLSINIEFNYKSDYADILKGFKDQSIDMALLGPLPYAILKSEYPDVKPIVSFKQKNGLVYYRCVLSKFALDVIDTSKPLKIALTQPLSTCGYFMSKKLLSQEFSLELKNQYYDYTMSHTNAVINVLEGKFDLAGSTETIAKKHESLGIVIVAKSDPLPGFSIVVNTKTLSKKEIKSLTDAFLNISSSQFKQWGGKTQYGVSQADEKSYEQLKLHYSIPKKGNMP